MIFVTVGAQMPFDRLLRAVDSWAYERDRNDIFAQIGKTDWRPRKIEFTPFLPPQEFMRFATRASVIVSHAGIGSIFTAMELGKPIIVMPRRASLHETRNDHQLATVRRFARCGITVAGDECELTTLLGRMEQVRPATRILAHASVDLLDTLRAFIERGASTPAST